MNEKTPRSISRRAFVRSGALGAAALTGTPALFDLSRMLPDVGASGSISANDHIQIALIGAGGMGGANVNTALRIPGVKVVGAADCYDGRLEAAVERWGEDVVTTRDYREILARDDVDAVIVATPDHWHQRIAIEALESGKSVYLEKPMVHTISEGKALIEAERRTGKTLQVGSQGMSSLGNEKARALLAAGAIGTLNYAEGYWARNSPVGAWQYAIPEDAGPETCDWDMFLGRAPKRSFDALRLFRWRNYRDYGTGVAGDLFVHLFSSLHFIVGTQGPTRVVATGGLRHWDDGREVPDVLLGVFDYPRTERHPAFNLSLRVNFVDGTSGSTFLRLVGSEGAMDVEWRRVVLRRNKAYGAREVFEPAEAEELAALYGERKTMLPPAEAVYRAEDDYWGAHYDHHFNFIRAVRAARSAAQDATFGMRAAGPALACNDSYFEGRIISWDPEKMVAS